mmetsp:Transcript_35533/g.42416  ORF Transcript_35533/g.42416 Transcript_35533/m.42416 type:complete len:177 (-) Transcript_35533:406-936(-)
MISQRLLLLQSTLAKKSILQSGIFRNNVRNMTVLSKESGETYRKENYSHRMNKTGRPVSPHVTIYQFPIAALTSITIRVTGCALTFGAAGVGLVEILAGNGAALGMMQEIAGTGYPVVTSLAKFSVSFPCVYHYLGGVRHLMWDNFPDMLTNVDVTKASYALVASSMVVSIAFVFV